eukprot:109403_1
MADFSWREMNDLTSEGSALYQTMSQTWTSNDTNSFIFMAYNDQIKQMNINWNDCIIGDENQYCKDLALKPHSKGFYAIDDFIDEKYSGYWIIHSQPQFPAIVNPTEPPLTPRDLFGATNGESQHFFCITIKGSYAWNQVIKSLEFMNTRFYLRRCGTNTDWEISPLYPVLDYWYMCDIYYVDAEHNNQNQKNSYSSGEIRYHAITNGFTHFAAQDKTNNLGENIWTVIADYYQTSFGWQTWGGQQSKCYEQKCENDKEFIHAPVQIFRNGNVAYQWLSTKDHAKIGVSLNHRLNSRNDRFFDRKFETNKKIVCWGDLNRSNIQILDSGGGYICAELQLLWFVLSGNYMLEPCDIDHRGDGCPQIPNLSPPLSRTRPVLSRKTKRKSQYDMGGALKRAKKKINNDRFQMF